MTRHRRFSSAAARQRGFSLIEVMVAILILGVGLLGFALLQTMNVRFTKSAQQRTIATTLAYEVIDLMRIQRAAGNLGAYNGVTFDEFEGLDTGDCPRDEDASTDANIERWMCQVHTALPDGAAQIVLDAAGNVQVDIRWGDANWSEDEAAVNTTFSLTSAI